MSEQNSSTDIIYPFQTPQYVSFFGKYFNDKLISFEDIDKKIKGDFVIKTNMLLFMGTQKVIGGNSLTDYGDLLYKEGSQNLDKYFENLIEYIRKNYPQVTHIQLDNIREDSPLYKWVKDINLKGIKNISTEKIEVAPYIDLSKSWDEYLLTLKGKDRQELKRKLKRLETVPYEIKYFDNLGDLFPEFVRLHRASNRNKELFMTDKMSEYFLKIANTTYANWNIKFALLKIEEKNAAMIMYFEEFDRILLYNSGFDPELNYYSPGLMLVALLIKDAIKKGIKVFDFMRGNERYKYDLGAKDMNLFTTLIKL